MNYRQKYKNALERARDLMTNQNPPAFDKHLIEIVFPELKDEDERIRKAIKKALQVRCGGSRIISDEPVTLEEALAWLEKQGEFDDNIITRNDEILQAISIGLTDVAEDVGWSDFGGIPIVEIQDWLEKQSKLKECDEEWEVTTGLYKCIKRMFDGTPESRLLFETGKLYKCISKQDIAEFESSYGHSVFLIDPVVRKHFIKVEDTMFKVGDRVVINCLEKFSTAYNGKEGTIINIFDLEKNHWGNIVVVLDNGMRNTFYESELIKK